MKDTGLDKNWNPKWLKVKADFQKIDDDIEFGRKSTPACKQYKTQYKKV